MGRRNKNIAKMEIYGVFRGFIESGDTKVTVSSVIEGAGLNRKTFYNHFAHIDMMVAWGFRYDLSELLVQRYDAADLLFAPSDPYEFEGQPCYVRNLVSALSLDQSEYIQILGKVFSGHADYYKVLLRSPFAAPLRRYLIDLYQGLFLQDVEFFLNNRKMTPESKLFVASFFAEGLVNQLIDSFLGLAPYPEQAGYASINNLPHECMLRVIEAYQAEKSAQHLSHRRVL